MTERKWTPGPWVVVEDKTAAQVKGYPCVYADGYTVIGTEGMYDDIEQDFANAHLIAAAPELYEALETVLSDLENRHLYAEEISAALRKARGEA